MLKNKSCAIWMKLQSSNIDSISDVYECFRLELIYKSRLQIKTSKLQLYYLWNKKYFICFSIEKWMVLLWIHKTHIDNQILGYLWDTRLPVIWSRSDESEDSVARLLTGCVRMFCWFFVGLLLTRFPLRRNRSD